MVLNNNNRKKLLEKPNALKQVKGPANAIFNHCNEVLYGKKGDDLEKDPSKWILVLNSGGKVTIEEGLVMYFAGKHGKVYLWL